MKVNRIKWILGYVDGYGKIHHKAVLFSDPIDNHTTLWGAPLHSKWRWMSSKPSEINTYGEDLDP